MLITLIPIAIYAAVIGVICGAIIGLICTAIYCAYKNNEHEKQYNYEVKYYQEEVERDKHRVQIELQQKQELKNQQNILYSKRLESIKKTRKYYDIIGKSIKRNYRKYADYGIQRRANTKRNRISKFYALLLRKKVE